MRLRPGTWLASLLSVATAPAVVLSLGCCCGGGMGSAGGGDPFSTGSSGVDTGSSDEPAADVSSPKTIDREGFTVQYPGNWSIDTGDPDYDPDALFSLDSAGNCFVMFHVFEHDIDVAEATAGQVTEFEGMLSGTSVSDFTTWGSYTGDGKQIQGKFLFLPTTVRTFAHATGDRSFIASEFCYDEDQPAVEPGFELVRGSFRLK